jgi:hypothetical protein
MLYLNEFNPQKTLQLGNNTNKRTKTLKLDATLPVHNTNSGKSIKKNAGFNPNNTASIFFANSRRQFNRDADITPV